MGRTAHKKPMQSEDGPVLVLERVDNPLTTWAQFLHEMDTDTPHAGQIVASVNLVTMLGGFARFHGTRSQNEAIKRFKSIYEHSQIGGAKAVDPGKEPVDGGGVDPAAAFERGADARKAWNAIVAALDRVDMQRLQFVVVFERGPTSYARWRYRSPKPDGRTISEGLREIRAIADRLAVALKLQSRSIA